MLEYKGKNNGMAKKWKLISPNNKEYIINGGIKRKLKKYNLTYAMFSYRTSKKYKETLNGWKLLIL